MYSNGLFKRWCKLIDENDFYKYNEKENVCFLYEFFWLIFIFNVIILNVKYMIKWFECLK